jgi:hypothetical protein
MKKQKVTGRLIETKVNAKKITLVKVELHMTVEAFLLLELIESKKLFFSEFADEPSWQIVDGKIYIIESLKQLNTTTAIDSPLCKDRNICFNWSTYTVMTKDEYKTWESARRVREENDLSSS